MFYKPYKFRIYPTNKQQVLIDRTFGCVRFVWNQLVENFNSLQNEQKTYETVKQLREKFPWLKEVSSVALGQKQRDFWEFIKQFSNKNRKSQLGRPNFKSRKSKQSYRLSNQKFYIKNNTIRLGKIGFIKIVLDRQIPQDTKLINATISKDKCGDYFVSILIEQNIEQKPKTGKEVGIDVGLKSFAVLSDGTYIDNLRYLNENQDKIKRLSQHLSRKQNGSNRYEKNRKKFAKEHRKVTRQRSYFLHELSSTIVNQYDIIAIQSLNVQSMLKNHKFARSISDASWSQFFWQLEYKCRWYGKELKKVDRFEPTSKTCSICGYIKQDMTLRDRQWTCPTCHTEHDRDLNSSKNILKKSVGINTELQTWRKHKTLKKSNSKQFSQKC